MLSRKVCQKCKQYKEFGHETDWHCLPADPVLANYPLRMNKEMDWLPKDCPFVLEHVQETGHALSLFPLFHDPRKNAE